MQWNSSLSPESINFVRKHNNQTTAAEGRLPNMRRISLGALTRYAQPSTRRDTGASRRKGGPTSRAEDVGVEGAHPCA